MKDRPLQLDTQRLLGFRLSRAADGRAQSALGAKVGSKVGSKG